MTNPQNPRLLEGEPWLMPDQDLPFNGDTFVEAEFLRLKDQFNIETVLELGTCVGGTTQWLQKNYKQVIAIELMPEFLDWTRKRVGFMKLNVNFIQGSTVDVLPYVLGQIPSNSMFFVDSHWGPNNPLLKELELIADFKLKPILCIHDFLVPGHPELGYDEYDGQKYKWDWIEKSIENIYGKEGYGYHYNSEAKGAMRGCVYIYPKV